MVRLQQRTSNRTFRWLDFFIYKKDSPFRDRDVKCFCLKQHYSSRSCFLIFFISDQFAGNGDGDLGGGDGQQTSIYLATEGSTKEGIST